LAVCEPGRRNMIYREFAKTGFKASAIGMGTYYDPLWIGIASILRIKRGKRTKIDALRTGLEHGINLIDTAEFYQSEPIVGEAIRSFRRDDIFLATKVSFPWNFSRDGVVKACERSIRRMNSGYIDLYQLHFPFRFGKIAEIMKGMEFLLKEGKVRAIGVSNFSLSQMQSAEATLSKAEISSNQMDYSLLHRQPEADLLPYCEANRKALIAYFPLAHGKLATVDRGVMQEVRKRTGATSTSQIALNWIVKRSPVTFAIPRASRPERVLLNSKATDFELGEDDMRALDGVSPLPTAIKH
jgi:diketogulonate reductase-like aldo/keto reductase